MQARNTLRLTLLPSKRMPDRPSFTRWPVGRGKRHVGTTTVEQRLRTFLLGLAGWICAGTVVELFLAEQAARHNAELLAERLDGLMSVVSRLTTATTEQQVAQLAVSSATEQLGAHAARLDLLGDDGLLHSVAVASDEMSVSTQFSSRLDLKGRGLLNVMRASVHVYNTEEELDRFAAALAAII